VLDEKSKAALLAKDAHNIVAVDLPHLPAKTVGPDETYAKAADTYKTWLAQKVLAKRGKPAVFVYQQTYTHGGKKFQRRGLMGNLGVQPFGKSPDGKGGIHPHEQTFSGPKEDRLKLMRATKAQLSPIFGLHSDADKTMGKLLAAVIDAGKATFGGRTANDGVLHEVWAVDAPDKIAAFAKVFAEADVFIADGHHRYTTALNYRNELTQAAGGKLPADHPANFCLFVLIAMQDPGMIVLPTHRVLGGMSGFTFEKFQAAAKGKLELKPFAGSGSAEDIAKLEAALPSAEQHAIGVYVPSNAKQPLWIATTSERDPLKATHAKQSEPWRQLDVAIVQHLIVEGICQPTFTGGAPVTWKFPHTIDEFKADTNAAGMSIGLLLQSTPLESVRLVSAAGELMPQKSTFFYPKLATGLAINPLE